MSPTVTPSTWRNLPARPTRNTWSRISGWEGQTLVFYNSSQRDLKGVSHCYQRLCLCLVELLVFLFSSLSLSFHSPPVSPCIALFDKGKEFTIKAQEGKRVQCEPFTTSASPLEDDLGTNVPAAIAGIGMQQGRGKRLQTQTNLHQQHRKMASPKILGSFWKCSNLPDI